MTRKLLIALATTVALVGPAHRTESMLPPGSRTVNT